MRIQRMAAFLAALFVSSSLHAEDFSVRPDLLRGTQTKQWRQYYLAIEHGIGNLPKDADIVHARDEGNLVQLTDTEWYYLDDELGEGYKNRPLLYFVRPWVPQSLETLTGDFHRTFGVRLKVTSLVRTNERHRQVQKTTTSAARAVPSAHLTGAAVDISFRGLTPEQIRWLRRRSVGLVKNRQAVVFEEISGGNFHFFFLPPPEPESPTLPVFPLAALIRCMP